MGLFSKFFTKDGEGQQEKGDPAKGHADAEANASEPSPEAPKAGPVARAGEASAPASTVERPGSPPPARSQSRQAGRRAPATPSRSDSRPGVPSAAGKPGRQANESATARRSEAGSKRIAKAAAPGSPGGRDRTRPLGGRRAQAAGGSDRGNGATLSQASGGDLEDAVDAAVDPLQRGERPGGRTASGQDLGDARAVAETFKAVAAAHASQLGEFMAQLAVGAAPTTWATPARAIVKPLLDAAKQMELGELADAFAAFDGALARTAAGATPTIGAELREELEQAYRSMVAQMPEAFSQYNADDGRSRVLLEALLLQLPSVHRRTLSRLYAAGLHSLERFSHAKPEELSQVAGIDNEVAGAIAKQVEHFERDRSRTEPSGLRSHVQDRLRTAVTRLSELQSEFERAEEEEAAERKRAARRARQTTAFEIEALFAQIGELALIEELKRSAMHRKIARVEAYLEQSESA